MGIVHLATCACVRTLHSRNYGLISEGINLAQHISFVFKISLEKLKAAKLSVKVTSEMPPTGNVYTGFRLR